MGCARRELNCSASTGTTGKSHEPEGQTQVNTLTVSGAAPLDGSIRREGLLTRFRNILRACRWGALALCGGVALMSAGLARAQTASIPSSGPEFGMWLSEKHDGVFRVARCGDALCGTLMGMAYKEGEPVPTGKDGRSECGLTMLTEFKPMSDPKGRWSGRILDPDSGSVYHAQIWSPSPDVLKLRGYVLVPIFGETQTWTRFKGTIGSQCRMLSTGVP